MKKWNSSAWCFWLIILILIIWWISSVLENFGINSGASVFLSILILIIVVILLPLTYSYLKQKKEKENQQRIEKEQLEKDMQYKKEKQERERIEKENIIKKYINDKFPNRIINKKLSLFDRNKDIIDYYLSTDSLWEINQNCCIADIAYSEWLFHIIDNNWNLFQLLSSAPQEYINLYKKIWNIFEWRKVFFNDINLLNEEIIKFNDYLDEKSNKIFELEILVSGLKINNDFTYISDNKKYFQIKDIINSEPIKLKYNENIIKTMLSNFLKDKTSNFSINDIYDKSEISIFENYCKIDSIETILKSFDKLQTFLISAEYNTISTKIQELSDKYWFIIEQIEDKVGSILETIQLKQDEFNKTINQVCTLETNDKQYIESYNSALISRIDLGIKFWCAYEILIDIFEAHFKFSSFLNDSLIEYNSVNKILVLDYIFPSFDIFPNLKDVKVFKNWTSKQSQYSEKEIEKLYDEYIKSLCLKTIYEIFINDTQNIIDTVSFNWWVDTIDKASWNYIKPCIMSIQIKKEEFININLANIDPNISFRTFKWISAQKLSTLTPIKPIMMMNKNDKRFVEWYDVVDWINSGTNLAAMDWQDFENLIRELFQKIYSQNGWEVKVTQASRDWWIDAVAFDPDPIKWWKIVIQAKRYTNVVWVSAVRDLYGSVMNEWAMKWILATTSYFWSDAYDFVKDKPITLISWWNLLFLLEEHWYNAHINLKEAKKVLNTIK